MSFGMHTEVGIKLVMSIGFHLQVDGHVDSDLYPLQMLTPPATGEVVVPETTTSSQVPVGKTGLVLTPDPLYQEHFFMQSDSFSVLTQAMKSELLSVIRVGAQKS